MEDSIAIRGARYVQQRALDGVAEVGRITMLLGDTLRFLIPGLRSFRLVVQQAHSIGVGSLGLVLVVSVFTGAVAAVQAAYQFSNVVPLKYLGSVILRSVIIELGPVLTALVVGGRVGASVAAELGTMKVTEQIDALRAMGINPIRFLVVPRVVASTVMLPVVTVFANAIAIFGGFVVAVTTLDVSAHTFVTSLKQFFFMRDLFSGLFKSVIFGGIIGTMGSYYGFATEGGAEGVGAATTRAVVSSCVLVLISDYVLAHVLFRFIFDS
ncbi:MAG TPA: ABC transporter permease [Candidatus Limnocylindria bacterium]|nr:ABC transporter permease [Candidatus Limnocylindria bacterium]